MQQNRLAFFLLFGVLTGFPALFPQSEPDIALAQSYDVAGEKAIKAEKERQKFLKEMRTLLEAALKSGFSEKEIREISVTRKGKKIHVWDFLEQEKLREKKTALAKKRAKPRDRYLTVMDVAAELESRETRQLDVLKEQSVFVGAEEK